MNEIRNFLWHPDQAPARDEALMIAAQGKAISGLTVAGGIVAVVVGLIAMKTFPILGALFALSSICVALLGRDASVMCDNLTHLINSWRDSLAASFSPEKYVDAVLKDTWVMAPLFRDLYVQALKESENRDLRSSGSRRSLRRG